jgi:translation initiation factor 6 (eIF-6)
MGKAGAKLRTLGQRGMTTAEYAVGTVAAVTGVGVLVSFFQNDAFRKFLEELVKALIRWILASVGINI